MHELEHIFAGLEVFDVANILTQQGGEAVYPLPHIKELLIHSKLNLAICLLTVYIIAFLKYEDRVVDYCLLVRGGVGFC